MRRDITTPDGSSWRVEIDWVGRRISNPIRRSIAATRRHKRDKGDVSGLGDGLDLLNPLAELPGPLGALFAVLAAILGLVLLVLFVVWVMPLIVVIAIVLFDFFFVTIAAVAVLAWRIVLRRPWRVVARPVEPDRDTWTHDVVGYRAARRRVREVARGLSLGTPPGDLGLGRA